MSCCRTRRKNDRVLLRQERQGAKNARKLDLPEDVSRARVEKGVRCGMSKDERLNESVSPDIDYLNPQSNRPEPRPDPWEPRDDLHVALFIVEVILPIVCSVFATTPAASIVIMFILPGVGTAIAWYLVRASRWRFLAIVCLVVYGIPLVWLLVVQFIHYVL